MRTRGPSRPARLKGKTPSFPLSIVLAHHEASARAWDVGRWEVVGVVAGEHAGAVPAPAAGDGARAHRVYAGFSLQLHRDDAESYYCNLVAERPSVFVICEQTDGGELKPMRVTVSYGEASAWTEVEETVQAVAMPPEVYRWVEQYVLEHYVPMKQRKRKRDDWKRPT